MVPNKVRHFMWRSCMQSLWSWIWFIRVLSEDVCKHCWNCSKIVLHTMGMPRTQCHVGIRLLGVVLSDHALLNLHGINATYHEGRKEPRIVRHNSLDHLVSQKHDPNQQQGISSSSSFGPCVLKVVRFSSSSSCILETECSP